MVCITGKIGKPELCLRKIAEKMQTLRCDRCAVAAIEFAIEAPVLFIMIFGIINFSDFAYTEYAVNKGTVAAVRYASIAATNAAIAASQNSNNFTCPTPSAVENQFISGAGPMISSGAISSFSLQWGGLLSATCAGSTAVATPPGNWVMLSVSYQWSPLILGSVFGANVSIKAQYNNEIIDDFSSQ